MRGRKADPAKPVTQLDSSCSRIKHFFLFGLRRARDLDDKLRTSFVPKDTSKSAFLILRKLSIRVDATRDAEVSMRLTSCEQIRDRDAGRKTFRISELLRKNQERAPNSPTWLPHPRLEHARASEEDCFGFDTPFFSVSPHLIHRSTLC